MKVRALINFASIEATLTAGQQADISDEVANDLITCGYVEAVEEKKIPKKKVVKKDEAE